MGFLVFVGVPEIYLNEYLIQSYIVLLSSTLNVPATPSEPALLKSDSEPVYMTIPPSTTKTCPVT
jgi:hypothetical protein